MPVMVEPLLPSVSVTVCAPLPTLRVWAPKLRDAGFATSVTLQMTVALTLAALFVSFGSRKFDAPPKSALAVLATLDPQVAPGFSVPVMVYVTDPFGCSVTFDVPMFAAPEASQVAPPAPAQVQVAAVTAAGSRSVIVGASVVSIV